MSAPGHTPKLLEIFNEALEQPSAAERAAYLDRVCGGDPALRGQVEDLLGAYQTIDSFLESPAQAPAETAMPEDLPGVYGPGASIGPYRLLEVIGEGGMGTVWKAEQTSPVRRTVALKVIKPGLDTRQVLSRFEAERQALALMDHPNIAKVLDAGSTEQGRPYFVMELVEGTPITRYCDEHRLSPRERLELAIPVCHAIQHAHQKGIIHRDIKPSNVLVIEIDSKPVPKVIDFGIAKATAQRLTDETLLTELGVVVGTAEYMSPEQAELNNGDIDTRSDIYCLGVLLYELLTGTTPLQHRHIRGAALLEVLRLVREEEPQKPSTRLSSTDELPSIAAVRNTEPRRLTGLVRGDLDWIVMKALEKDRGRRYETVNGLARDIQRFLADEPVEAGPPSNVYRLRKFVRRHRRTLVTSALVVVPVLVLGSTGYLWTESQRAKRMAATTRSVSAALDEAQRLRGEAQAGPAGEMNKWNEALSAARRADGLVAQGEADAVLRSRVATALAEIGQERANFEEKARQLAIDRTLLSDLETIRASSAEHFDPKSTDAEYAAAFRKAGLDIDATDPNVAGAWIASRTEPVELASHLDECALVRRRTARPETDWLRLVSIVRAADPDPWRNRLRETLYETQGGARLAALRDLARSAKVDELPTVSLNLLGVALYNAGDLHAAESLLRTSQRRYPRDVWLNSNLAVVLWKLTRRDEAMRYYTAACAIRPETAHLLAHALEDKGESDEAIAVFQDLARLRPKHSGHLVCLGSALKERGRSKEATAALDAAIAILREAIQLEPNNAVAHGNLGMSLMDQGKLDQAIAELREATRLRPDWAEAQNNLGLALKDQGKLDEAIARYLEAIRLQPDHAIAHCNLGSALKGQGKLDDAIAKYHEALRLKPDLAQAHNGLGAVLYEQGKLNAAIAAYQEAIRLKPDLAEAHYNLGYALYKQGELDEAMAEWREAIRFKPYLAEAHNNLGVVLNKKGEHAKAIDECEEAIRLRPDYAAAHANLGNALHAVGRLDEAMVEWHKAIRLQPDLAEARNNLGSALGNQGKLEQAIDQFREANRLTPEYPDAHWNLGVSLLRRGDYAGAVDSLRKARELAGPEPDRRFPGIGQALVEAERCVALADRLPAILKGDDAPKDNAERLFLGLLCYKVKHYAAAARHWNDAFESDPKLADDHAAFNRYNAACVAALAGCGQGDDAPTDEAAKAKLRGQALDWLRIELPHGALNHWLGDSDLADVRDADALEKLPESERAAWQALWSEVNERLKQTK